MEIVGTHYDNIDGVEVIAEDFDDMNEEEISKYVAYIRSKITERLDFLKISKADDGRVSLGYSRQGPKFERIRRITGYLVGTTDRWNNAKRMEEQEREKHDASVG